MGAESGEGRPLEQIVEDFLRRNYPTKRAWVKENLDTLNSFRKRKDPKRDDYQIVSDAIATTVDFAANGGINPSDRHETDVLHIPSRLAAIRKFESGEHPLRRQLPLDRILQILVIAESTNIRRSMSKVSGDEVQQHLNNLTNLIKLHKELRRY